jgi:hypothetical protein
MLKLRIEKLRKSKMSALELEEQELRKESRKKGYSMMDIRDRGWAKLSNGSIIEWSVDRPLAEGEVRRRIEKGTVILDEKLYDVDELLRWLRWA